MMETVISGLSDIWPALLRKNKALFTFVCCMVGFALGIPMTTRVSIALRVHVSTVKPVLETTCINPLPDDKF